MPAVFPPLTTGARGRATRYAAAADGSDSSPLLQNSEPWTLKP